jgi:pyrimidine-nucleoside phosphorylase
MQVLEIIAKKRDGRALTPEELVFFVEGYTQGAIPDYQAAALLMAIYLRGMDTQETAALTAAMAHSGERLELSEFPGALDKHSTGGVGDKTSLIVVPILAAAGVPVCKMSGRGLGHTGGTLDKLEAIPGFQIEQSAEQMRAQVRQVGACIVGQTATLAPADKKLYALRDATATVACLPLIVSSILSKKLAGGAPAFLFDVKVGSGALMKTEDEARALAEALVVGAAAHGRRATALVTDMSQPLGRTIGNALEVQEATELLRQPDKAEKRLKALCLALAGQGIALALRVSPEEGRRRAAGVLESGEALRVWEALVRAQGGDPMGPLPHAPVVHEVRLPGPGILQRIETQALGELVVRLGGGRVRKDDTVDVAVGLELLVQVGDALHGQPIARIHAQDTRAAEAAEDALCAALSIGAEPVGVEPLIQCCIDLPTKISGKNTCLG